MRAAVRGIDLDRNQFVDGAEAGRLKALLGDERSGRDVEAFQALSGRGQEALAGLETGFQDARAKLEGGGAQAARGQVPRRSASELKQERASLADPAKLQATLQEKTASIAATSARLKGLEAQLAGLERQAREVKRARLGSMDLVETVKQSMAMLEAELARTPRGPKREALEKQLEARRDRLDSLQPRLAELRASIDGLEGTLAQDTRALQDARATLAEVQPRAPVLDAQLEHVEARGRFEAEKAQRDASAGVLNLAAGRLGQASWSRELEDRLALDPAVRNLRGAEARPPHALTLRRAAARCPHKSLELVVHPLLRHVRPTR